MSLLAIDCATTSGLALQKGDGSIRAYSFCPRAKRAFEVEKGKIDYRHRGLVMGEFRRHLIALINTMMEEDDRITDVAIEEPLRSDLKFRKPVVDTSTAWAGQAVRYEERGGTSFSAVYGLYGLHTAACEVAADRNINIHIVHQNTWRSSFYRGERPPRGCDDPSKWWKQHAKKYCEMLKVPVPNADAAEAVGILYWLKSQVEPKYAAADSLFGRV